MAEAGRLGLDPAALQGSGRNGRVSVQDVHQAARPQAAPQLVGVYSATPDSPILSTPVARRLCALHGLDLAAVQGSGPRGKVRRDDVLALVSRNAVQPSPSRSHLRELSRRHRRSALRAGTSTSRLCPRCAAR
ncbi:E3 binding domain-containing protein [Novosphingobium panipatense]